MGLHDVEFVRAEFPGLEEDRVGDADLADVVKRRGVFHELGRLAVEAQLARTPSIAGRMGYQDGASRATRDLGGVAA